MFIGHKRLEAPAVRQECVVSRARQREPCYARVNIDPASGSSKRRSLTV
jgi:hypothetical protein